MEFRITMRARSPDLPAIENTVHAADPAALIDLEGNMLRVATSLQLLELVSVISATGYRVDAGEVVQMPSICCGGCGG